MENDNPKKTKGIISFIGKIGEIYDKMFFGPTEQTEFEKSLSDEGVENLQKNINHHYNCNPG